MIIYDVMCLMAGGISRDSDASRDRHTHQCPLTFTPGLMPHLSENMRHAISEFISFAK